MTPQVILRGADADDVSFIYSSWLRCFHDTSTWAQQMPRRIFFDNHKKVIEKVLAESNVVVAANPEDPGQIFGYVVFQPSVGKVAVLHWVYVKEPFRRLGIAADLFAVAKRIAEHDELLPVVGTHYNLRWDVLATKWNLVFNPYLLGAADASDVTQVS